MPRTLPLFLVLLACASAPAIASEPGRANQPGRMGREHLETSPSAEPPLLTEGSFVRSARGRLGRLGSDWLFFFDADASGSSPRPMPVMPSTALMEMKRLVESRAATITFSLTAEIFLYRGQNHLLPRTFAVAANAPKPAEPIRPDQGPQPAEPRTRDPATGDLLRGMETGDLPRLQRPRRSAEAAHDPPGLRREGEFLKARRARLERESATRWRLVFDNDAAEPSKQDAPLRPLPCMTLERMENVAQRFGESVPLIVSGQVFVYEGENFILPTMLTLDFADVGEIKPAQ